MQAIFFILAVSFCGSFSVPLQPMESTDIVKEDSQMHLNQTFVSDLISNPQQFIAQVTKLDPVELQRIIALLIDLKGTSEAREADLVLALDTKNAEYVNTGNAIVDAETAVTDAQTVVTDAQGVVVVKEADLASANAAHAAKGIEKDDAQKAHDAEVPSLDDEQQVLSDVINMLEGLHPTQGCPSTYIPIGETCYSEAARPTSATNDNSCQKVDDVCTDEGAVLANKDEFHVWLNNGGDSLGMRFGHTSNKNGDQYWLTSWNADHGWHPSDCDRTDFWFICVIRN